LFVSIRGALALPVHIDLPAPPPNPCLACIDRPCLSACPVDALSSQKYDLPLCKDHITTVDRSGCMTHGCAARRACPVSRSSGRLPAQSAYHMQRFIAP
jgi:Fe-S-cluster-containing hydrogenase component 2